MSDNRVVGVSVDPTETQEWVQALKHGVQSQGLPLTIDPDAPNDQVDYLVYNIDGGLTDFTDFKRLRAILNTWAGVEAIVGKVTWPDHIPFCRMVEPGLTDGMVEYMVGHTLRYHLDIDRAINDSARRHWEKWEPPLAVERSVGVLGLGALGATIAAKMVSLGFNVTGWSRSQKDLQGVRCLHGDQGLTETLQRSEILIVILPLTQETENILDAQTLSKLPEGAAIINAGRGPLIDDDALLDAIARGHIRHATLDVFRTEPLPQDHAFWGHPKITITPHIAAITRASTASIAILQQIGRDMAGEPLLHIVDPDRGY